MFCPMPPQDDRNEGMQTRGHGDVRDIRGVICQHTCGPTVTSKIMSVKAVANGTSPNLPKPIKNNLSIKNSGADKILH
jgi:hypothetical protein